MLKRSDQKAFSMVEALVAAVILSISVVGVLSTMSSQKAPSQESDQKVLAAMAAKQFLEGLRSKVDATTFATGELSLGLHSGVSLGTYTVDYLVTAAGNARKVELNITW
jgi:Tfp pilus assembly protein PilV